MQPPLAVGATFAATVIGASIARSSIDRMMDPDFGDEAAPLNGEEMDELMQQQGRTRLRPEDVPQTTPAEKKE
eukprot:gene9979-7859_t